MIGIGMPGPTELLIIFGIVLLVFGGKRLPEIAKGLGRGMRDFKRAFSSPPDENVETTQSKAVSADTKNTQDASEQAENEDASQESSKE